MSTLLRVLIGVLFVLAGVQKGRDPRAFRLAIRKYEILSDKPLFLEVVTVMVPAVELVNGVLLMGGWFIGVSCSLAALLLLAFSFMPVIAELRGNTVPNCGCPSFLGKKLAGSQLLLRNLGLACFLVPGIQPKLGMVSLVCGGILLATLVGIISMKAATPSISPENQQASN
jgi:hypothetical protein